MCKYVFFTLFILRAGDAMPGRRTLGGRERRALSFLWFFSGGAAISFAAGLPFPLSSRASLNSFKPRNQH